MQTIRPPYDDGKRDTLVMIEGNFPSVSVAEVLEDYALGIDTLLLGLIVTIV